MANKKAGGKKQDEKALVRVNRDLELPAELILELEQSRSLQEIDEADRMTPYFCFNVKFKDPEGNWYPLDVFFHTLREDTKPVIDCVLLFLHKTNRYRTFDDNEGSKTLCRSLDCQYGIWQETGEERLCRECEYNKWINHSVPPCKLCYNFVGVDLDGLEPFIITAKSTSMTPAKRFLNQNFLKKLQGGDLPLYVYQTRLGLERPNGTYSVLTFERGPANSPKDIRAFAKLTEELLASSRLDFTFDQPENAEAAEVAEQSEEGNPSS